MSSLTNAGRVWPRRLLAAGLVAVACASLAGCGGSPVAGGTPLISTPTPPDSPTPSPGPVGPVKGLSDNPAFQWWRWTGGAQPDSWWGASQTAASLAQQTALMNQLGVKVFRVELVWAFVEPTMPGGAVYDRSLAQNPDWSGYQWQRWDMIVDAANAAGLRLLPVVYYTPSWAGGVKLSLYGGPNAPPRSVDYYGDFMRALVTRYTSRIHYWELGNEPDYGARSWNGTLAQYVQLMLRPGYEAIKAVDPSAKVLMGGLAGDTHMQAMYAAGAGPYFDIASVHAYYAAASGDSTAIDHIRGAMRANGDSSKPIWLTEFGMATRAPSLKPLPGQGSNAAEAAQAGLIHDIYAGFRVQAVFFYELRDTAVYSAAGPIKFVYWGLISRDFAHQKSGFDAYGAAPSPDLPQ